MRLIVFVLFFSFSFTTINAQSKTERAVKKLRSNKVNSDDDDDDDDNSFFGDLIGDIIGSIFESLISSSSDNDDSYDPYRSSRRSSYSNSNSSSYKFSYEDDLRARQLQNIRQLEMDSIKPNKLQPNILPELKETDLIYEENTPFGKLPDTSQKEIIESTISTQNEAEWLTDNEDEEIIYKKISTNENYEFIAFPYVSKDLNKTIRLNQPNKSRTHLEMWTGNNSEQKTLGLELTYEELVYDIHFKYQNLKEHLSPFPIDQLSITLGLKPINTKRMSFDFNGGLHTIYIDGENFGGLTFGAGLALYPIQPLSFEFNGNIIFGDGTKSTTSDVSLNLHLDRIKLGFGLNYLNLQGVEFNTLQIKLGLYF